MINTKKMPFLMLAIFLFLVSQIARGDEPSGLPRHLLPRAAALTEIQKGILLEAISEEECYGECDGTILDCLTKKRPDKTAVRLANFCAYLLSSGASKTQVVAILKERVKFGKEKNPAAFTYEHTPAYGDPRSKITITEFAEFKCPYCAKVAPLLKKLVEESGGAVCLFFKHFPLKKNPGSVLTSMAAQAAHRQGKFWEMCELLYQNMHEQSLENLLKYAEQIGLNMDRFRQDLEGARSVVERDKIEGVRAKVPGTPTLFINGKFFDMRYYEPFLKDIVNEEAERLGLAPPYKDWVYEGS